MLTSFFSSITKNDTRRHTAIRWGIHFNESEGKITVLWENEGTKRRKWEKNHKSTINTLFFLNKWICKKWNPSLRQLNSQSGVLLWYLPITLRQVNFPYANIFTELLEDNFGIFRLKFRTYYDCVNESNNQYDWNFNHIHNVPHKIQPKCSKFIYWH